MLYFTSQKRKYVIRDPVFLTFVSFWHLQRFLVDKKFHTDS